MGSFARETFAFRPVFISLFTSPWRPHFFRPWSFYEVHHLDGGGDSHVVAITSLLTNRPQKGPFCLSKGCKFPYGFKNESISYKVCVCLTFPCGFVRFATNLRQCRQTPWSGSARHPTISALTRAFMYICHCAALRLLQWSVRQIRETTSPDNAFQ